MFYFYFYCFVNIDKKWMFRERIFRFTWHSRQINSRCHTHVCALLSGGGDLWTANPLGRATSMEANVELWNGKKEKEIEKSAIRERASVPSGVIISLK